MSIRGWRSRLGIALAGVGLLGVADRALRWVHVAGEAVANRRFRAGHPGFAIPPAALCFETLGHVSASDYHDSGRAHATLLAGHIGARVPRPDPAVLEWGCGAGRILRWMRGPLPHASLAGADVDSRCIAWCRENLAGIEFRECGLLPPLPAADRSLDAVYCYSVWTHLSETSIEAWVRDIARTLRDDGILLGTSHGDRYADMLLPGEASEYRQGRAVVHDGFPEGRKRFLGFHPPAFIESLLLRHFRRAERLATPADADIPQDLWCAQGPRR